MQFYLQDEHLHYLQYYYYTYIYIALLILTLFIPQITHTHYVLQRYCPCITGAIHKFPVMANGNTDTKKLTNTIKKRKRKKKEKTSRSY